MRPQDIMKLALFTRRFGKYRNPFAYRLSRALLKLVLPKEAHRPYVVLGYDRQNWENHGSEDLQALAFLAQLEYRTCFIKNDIIFPLTSDLSHHCDILGVPKKV